MIKKSKHDFYVGRRLEPHEQQIDGFHPEHSPKPMLKDTVIESDDYRKNLKLEEGDISIFVEAGDELGQIRVAVQYEGKKGESNKCLSRQGALIHDVSSWLKEIYKKFEGDFEIEMISELCPKGDTRRLLNQLGPTEGVTRKADVTPRPGVGVTSSAKVGK